tara:strand:+ start:25376 stop:25873 length:498 start_codon:yes stop_codon:yes gene_type:complete
MNALFSKLHRALVQSNSDDVGISFPDISTNQMGKMLRIHGHKPVLDTLMNSSWLDGVRDHVALGKISPVPSGTKHCRVQRVQAKSNADRLRRRYQRRHPELSSEQIEVAFTSAAEKRLDLPYLQLRSQSTGQNFPIFIRQFEVAHQMDGVFNAYGFSQTATLPLF